MSRQSEAFSEMLEIAKHNGDFRKNYESLGAYLYLRSINAVRSRSLFWTGLISIVCSAALAWLARHSLAWLYTGDLLCVSLPRGRV